MAAEGRVERWVRRLNAMARDIDELAACTHPSAWNQDPRLDEWKKLARRGP